MPRYRRAKVEGGVFFFTMALADRSSDLLVRHTDRLRRVYTSVRERYPFETIAICVLPDHLHAIWSLPQSSALEPDQEWIFSRTPCRCATQLEQDSKARERDLAAPLLGTHHSRRCRLGSSCRL